MMQASIHGRAAFDARQHTTKAGKPMTRVRLAVDVTGRDPDDQQTLWLDVLAFSLPAAQLAKVTKGEMVTAIGRVTRSTYTKPGIEQAREQWTLLADAVLTTRSARPGQHRQAKVPDSIPPWADAGPSHDADAALFDDDIPL